MPLNHTAKKPSTKASKGSAKSSIRITSPAQTAPKANQHEGEQRTKKGTKKETKVGTKAVSRRRRFLDGFQVSGRTLLAEGVGTAIFSTAIFSVGEPLPIAAGLYVGIRVASPPAKAYLNPAMAIAGCLNGDISAKTLGAYIGAEIVGALVGLGLSRLIKKKQDDCVAPDNDAPQDCCDDTPALPDDSSDVSDGEGGEEWVDTDPPVLRSPKKHHHHHHKNVMLIREV